MFKLKRIEKLIDVRNINGTFNKVGPIEHTVEVNIFYKEYIKRTKIDVIGEQKWNVILELSWLIHNNPEIDWKTGKVNMTRHSK